MSSSKLGGRLSHLSPPTFEYGNDGHFASTAAQSSLYDLPALWDYDATPLAAFADEPYDKVFGSHCGLGVTDEYGTNQFYAGLITRRCPRAPTRPRIRWNR